MAKRIKVNIAKRIIFLLPGLLCIITSIPVIAYPQSQQLTQAEFTQEIYNAYIQNNDRLAISLIRDNRLFVKPFVNGLIKESILNELNGNIIDAKQKELMAGKVAKSFEEIFGEKSLRFAVEYLTSWSKQQKMDKLAADSLYDYGTSIRGTEEELEKAVGCYQKALDIYRNIGDERGEAEILGGLGLIYWNLDYEKSLSYYQDALIKREKVDDIQLIGNSLNSIGIIYSLFLNDYQKAGDYLDRAAELRAEIGDSLNLKRTLINRAEAFLKAGTYLDIIGRYPEALENLEKALEINREINSRVRIGVVLSQTGFVYSNLGDNNTAIKKIIEAEKIIKEEGDLWELAGVYNHMGVVLQKAGRIDKAYEYYNSALKIYEEEEDIYNQFAILSNLGTLFFDKKDYSMAEEYHSRGLIISRETNDKDLEVRCLLNLANDQSMLGKLDDAWSNYESAYQIAKSLNNPELNWKIIAGMAENYEQRGNYIKAVELNDSALTILEGMRNTLQSDEWKASFMAMEHFAFEDIINMLSSLHEKESTKGYDKLAFQFAERSKSRAFLDLLAESLANVKEGADKELLKRQEEILISLTEAKQKLQQESLSEQADMQIVSQLKEIINNTEEELGNIKREIRFTNPGYADLQYPQPVSLEEVQSICPDNTVFLEYSVGDSSSSLWVITRSEHHLYMLPDRKVLQEKVETLRFALLNPDQGDNGFFTEAGYLLYDQLIKPAESAFSKKSRLVIIPDGILNYLPFEVLLTERGGLKQGASYSDLPFLVKKFPISYGQSASILKSLISEKRGGSKSGTARKKLIAFGDPVYENINDSSIASGDSYKRLEYSGREVENIASFFQKGSAELYLRNDATEENVKKEGALEQFNYIHFATHGFIDEVKPDFSSLIFTHEDNSGEDGLLQATEIFNLNLNADMVVLSACQTGLGKLIRGEGIVGLTRAFMYAGTPTVMVSLWSVSDVSTATLMGDFYENLVKKKLNITDALRKAQLSMLRDEKFAHPFYWAPFVIFGDWR
jgi:CHAT domain-containing protein/tetratricopeptide (TPR) repeat protein